MTDLTPDQQAKLDAATRQFRDTAYPNLPPAIREVAVAFPPFLIYRIRSTGVRGLLLRTGVTADGRVKLTLACVPSLNPGWAGVTGTGEQVFGLDPDDIEPADADWDAVDEYLAGEENGRLP